MPFLARVALLLTALAAALAAAAAAPVAAAMAPAGGEGSALLPPGGSGGAKVEAKPAYSGGSGDPYGKPRERYPHKHGAVKVDPPPSAPPPLCKGASCARMSALLPLTKLTDPTQKVQCSCADFNAGACFAPGCFPCAKSCFAGLPPFLAAAPGPFGTGLLCSTGCTPCCQKASDPALAPNNACQLAESC